MDNVKSSKDTQDLLLNRLQMKHAHLRVNHLVNLKSSVEQEHSDASKKMHKLPISLDLLSDEIVLTLNEITVRCEEYGVPHVGQLLKDVRAMMNQQLREAYSHIEAGYKSAFHKLEEEQEARKRRQDSPLDRRRSSPAQCEKTVASDKPPGKRQSVSTDSRDDATRRHKWSESGMTKALSIGDAFSTTTSFFAEAVAVLLKCEVVRIYLYDAYDNLKCCTRFPFDATRGDPMSGTYLELMLAKEIHTTVCQRRIAVNGREPQQMTIRECDRKAMEEEIEQSGWKSMTSCLIFPIFADDSKKSFGMIHAMNKQGFSEGAAGTFTEDDETLILQAARLFGSLLSRYPTKYFMHDMGDMARQFVNVSFVKEPERDHLPQVIVDEVEAAAVVGNKAVQASPRVLIYRAPVNIIYQTRAIRKKARKLAALHIVDRALSTVEFDITALEELWRVGHEENRVMYEHCQQLNEKFNTLQVLLQHVLDGIGASRNIQTLDRLVQYLRTLEVYARQENISMITDLISEALLHGKVDGLVPEEVKELNNEPLTNEEVVRLERRLERVEGKLKFGASTMQHVQTYSCNPDLRREQVRFFNNLAEKRTAMRVVNDAPGDTPRYESQTASTRAKVVKQKSPDIIHFGPSDYASKRPFRLGDI
ncbi:hypothetical protein ERJ75_000713000 [Trypanosoma vivax]|uniref:GAF domain-containing protein n=1 Tax=Trypanosoma vivax (strain Y486) TaxID=1055687 RepID=G0TTU3_TRYVY|nr:hypothetical protein TRVL_00054 [Trypanosoma vivax]KAH8613728.1 hypothetical protein ERJ75_000713000 [Trypanosoma vivax]CCC47375.1 conserved hypothetical protein [Trypanosoma vivax Y486]